jgi:hypothetical protein
MKRNEDECKQIETRLALMSISAAQMAAFNIFKNPTKPTNVTNLKFFDIVELIIMYETDKICDYIF